MLWCKRVHCAPAVGGASFQEFVPCSGAVGVSVVSVVMATFVSSIKLVQKHFPRHICASCDMVFHVFVFCFFLHCFKNLKTEATTTEGQKLHFFDVKAPLCHQRGAGTVVLLFILLKQNDVFCSTFQKH